MASVVVLGGSEETRLLLRGLLRLHRHQVIAEGATVEALARLPAASLQSSLVLVVDVNLDEGGWGESMERVFREHPLARGVLLSPSRSARVDSQAKTIGFTSVVRRPFSMMELIAAVSSAAEDLNRSGAGPASSPAGGPPPTGAPPSR